MERTQGIPPSIFVGNIDPEEKPINLFLLFSKHGTVTNLHNNRKGYAIVSMSDHTAAQNAIRALHGTHFGPSSRKLRVEWCRNKDITPRYVMPQNQTGRNRRALVDNSNRGRRGAGRNTGRFHLGRYEHIRTTHNPRPIQRNNIQSRRIRAPSPPRRIQRNNIHARPIRASSPRRLLRSVDLRHHIIAKRRAMAETAVSGSLPMMLETQTWFMRSPHPSLQPRHRVMRSSLPRFQSSYSTTVDSSNGARTVSSSVYDDSKMQSIPSPVRSTMPSAQSSEHNLTAHVSPAPLSSRGSHEIMHNRSISPPRSVTAWSTAPTATETKTNDYSI